MRKCFFVAINEHILDLTGNDEWDAARCDMIVDWAIDMRTKLRPVYVAKLGGDMEKMVRVWGRILLIAIFRMPNSLKSRKNHYQHF